MSQHPTIRTLSGVQAIPSLDATKTALLVIDFQNEYFNGKMPIPDGTLALNNAKRLIAYADKIGIKVYHVQHIMPAGSAVFAESNITSKIHTDIQPAVNHTLVTKTSVSVFASTDLHQQLKIAGIDTLIITGLMTHACVAGAARDAAPLGYSVIVVADACATRDLDTASGETISHSLLHQAALASIDDTFGDIMTTERLLQLAIKSA